MALPPLVSPEELATRFPALGDAAGLAGAAAAASALARAYTKRPTGWVNEEGALTEVPDAVAEAVLLIARRVALMPDDGVSDEAAGPFSVKRDSSMWLSATEKILLDTAMNLSTQFTTVTVQGPVSGKYPGTYLPVGVDGQPVSWE